MNLGKNATGWQHCLHQAVVKIDDEKSIFGFCLSGQVLMRNNIENFFFFSRIRI